MGFGNDLKVFDTFTGMKVTLVAAPFDMRKGFRSFEASSSLLGIKLHEGNDVVVFLSKTCKIAKLVWADRFNSYCLTCYPHQGGYQKLLVQASNITGEMSLTVMELKLYLSGNKIQTRSTPFGR